MEELLGYEIENILFDRVRDVFPHHQKIISVCDTFCNAVSNSVKKERAQKQDYNGKIENNATIIADTSNLIKNLQNESAAVLLQQKVLEKQINNILKQQEELREQITVDKSQEESYTLEIVDLQSEIDKSKMEKKLKWDAIKRIINTYKSTLQFSIQIIDSPESCNKIRVIFFKSEQDDDQQYYVDLTYTADSWRVDLIHPSLEPNDQEQLKHIVNFKKQQEISDVTAFLCAIRKVFKQQSKS